MVGGILVGRDLITAGYTRSQISQIERFQQAKNAFRTKYEFLPGDIRDPQATTFGLKIRGTYLGSPRAGGGDGNGIIEGLWANSANNNACCSERSGETAVFWKDLADAQLIEGQFTAATFGNGGYLYASSDTIKNLLPEAKLGKNNYVYVWSGGTWGVLNNQAYSTVNNGGGDGNNYFGISSITNVQPSMSGGELTSSVGMTVQQAFNIDKKMDDGLPQSGAVQAWYLNTCNCSGGSSVSWANGVNFSNGSYDATTGGAVAIGAANPQFSETAYYTAQHCYVINSADATVQTVTYNLAYANNLNCALSFKFQ